MNRITAPNKDLEFRNEYNNFNSVFYKGAPFTGVLIDDLETITYKDGYADGEYLIRYPNGELQGREIFENQNIIESEYYYEGGAISSRRKPGFIYTRWSREGRIVQEGGNHYFPNGQVYKVVNDGCTIYYAPNGEEVFRRVRSRESITLQIDTHYNFQTLGKWCFELLKQIPYGSDESNRIYYLSMWLWKLFEVNQAQYFGVINKLLRHPDENVLERITNIIAYHKFVSYIEPENEMNMKAYKLIKKHTINCENINPDRVTKKVNL